jgi:hypothetical protein
MMHAFISLGFIHHLLSLSSNYFELRADSIPAPAVFVAMPDSCVVNRSWCEIPIRTINDLTEDFTLVSPQDYDRLVAIAPVWRVSNSGYVVTSRRVDGRYRMTYMHREVAGSTATHINGDRLDNRRENLAPTRPRGSPIMLNDPETPFLLYSAPEIDDRTYIALDETRPGADKQQTVVYPSGKVYSGEVLHGVPHGLGSLVEKNRTSFGWFMHGQFRNGVVLDHPPVCKRLRYLYVQDHVRPICGGFLVNKNGFHEDIVGDRIRS